MIALMLDATDSLPDANECNATQWLCMIGLCTRVARGGGVCKLLACSGERRLVLVCVENGDWREEKGERKTRWREGNIFKMVGSVIKHTSRQMKKQRSFSIESAVRSLLPSGDKRNSH